MRIFFNKFVSIAVHLICIAFQLTNCILPSIIVHEATNGVKFDITLLLSNRYFWILLFLQIIYAYITYHETKRTKESDDRLKTAIETEEILLYAHVTDLIKKKEFDSADKAMEMIDKYEERRSK